MKDKSILMAFVLCVVAIMLFSCQGSRKNVVAETQPQQKQEIVYAGIENYKVGCFETLSDIAVKYIPSDEYMNDWIADVKRLNGRKTNDIYFGEVIKVYYF